MILLLILKFNKKHENTLFERLEILSKTSTIKLTLIIAGVVTLYIIGSVMIIDYLPH